MFAKDYMYLQNQETITSWKRAHYHIYCTSRKNCTIISLYRLVRSVKLKVLLLLQAFFSSGQLAPHCLQFLYCVGYVSHHTLETDKKRKEFSIDFKFLSLDTKLIILLILQQIELQIYGKVSKYNQSQIPKLRSFVLLQIQNVTNTCNITKYN